MSESYQLRGPIAAQIELVQRVRSYIRLRFFYLTIIGVAGAIAEWSQFGYTAIVQTDLALFAFGIITNVLFLWFSKLYVERRGYFLFLAAAPLIMDLLIISNFLFLHGAAESRGIILFTIPIVISVMLFGRVAGYITATLSSLSYGSILLLDLLQYVPHPRGQVFRFEGLPLNFSTLAGLAIFYTVLFFVVAAVADSLLGLSRANEAERAQAEMIALASHQLRTPATAVKGFLSTVIDSQPKGLTKQQADYLHQAYLENERELRLVNNMLNVAKVDSHEMALTRTKVDVSKLLQAAVDACENLLKGRKQTLKMNVPKEPVMAELDREKTFIILENLLNNACKYTPPGGHIDASVRAESEHVIVTIEDNGSGVDKKDFDRLFKRFSRAVRSDSTPVEGAGLGLYLVKKLVDLHGGVISFVSYPGEGAIFTVRLPKNAPQVLPWDKRS
jgi:signal transduction histidine kinase